MLEHYTSRKSVRHIEAAIAKLPQYVDMALYENPQFVCYGSFATNNYKAGSDMDMLLVHHSSHESPKRIQAYYGEYPVSLYTLSTQDLIADGQSAKYGGFFTGKLINPHIWVNASEEIQQLASDAAIRFIHPYAQNISAQNNHPPANSSDIGSHVIQGYLHICPWYKYYFLKIFSHADFPEIWQRMSDKYKNDFVKSGLLTDAPNARYAPAQCPSLHEETIIRAARFWSTGAVFHHSDPNFVDFYIAKAAASIATLDGEKKLKQMADFLNHPPLPRKPGRKVTASNNQKFKCG